MPQTDREQEQEQELKLDLELNPEIKTSFTVTMINTRGEKVSFLHEAYSLAEARRYFRKKYPSYKIDDLKITPKKWHWTDIRNIKSEDIEAAINPLTIKDKAVFSRQFATMVKAGVPVLEVINTLQEQSENLRLKKILKDVEYDVQQGISLGDALAKHPKAFDNLYVAMVRAGEAGGMLEEVLQRLAKVLQDSNKLSNQVKSALAYPIAVGVIAVIVFLGMAIFMIPIFANIFKNLGTELPEITLFMLGISQILTSWLILIPIVVTIVLIFAYIKYYQSRKGRLALDKLFLKLPIIGDINEKMAVARFCRTYGSLLKSGVPTLEALRIVQNVASNVIIVNAIGVVREDVKQGVMMSPSMKSTGIFPGLAVKMMAIGEKTGKVDEMLINTAEFYEDEVEQAVKALTSILEPIMMVFLAGMVAVILLSMYMPMFKVFEKLG